MTPEDLSPDQKIVFNEMCHWAEATSKKPILTIGGFAGSGKSTLTGVFSKWAEMKGLLIAYIAYTGRASSVLARKLSDSGLKVTTKPRRDDDSDLLQASYAKFFDVTLSDRDTGPAFVGTIHKLVYRPVIDKRGELKGFDRRSVLDRDYDIIVVDEASMVSDEMLVDLSGYGIPILAVGDHGQLAPVKGKGSLVQNPDLRLEKIHRQAADNPIIALSAHIREGAGMKELARFADGDRLVFQPRHKVRDVLVASGIGSLAVGALCWTNRNRIMINGLARGILGLKGKPPSKGEVVICLKNKPPVFNGMRGVLLEDAKKGLYSRDWELEASIEFPDDFIPAGSHILCAPQFNREKTFGSVEDMQRAGIKVDDARRAGDLYDYGYCLTIHKSQGSQFDHAIVYVDWGWKEGGGREKDQGDAEDVRRMAYTAVTRASRRLTVLV